MPAYISEIDTRGGAGGEFVEVAVDAGTDLSGYAIYIYQASGTVLSGPYGLGTLDGSIAGQDVYVVQDNPEGLPGIKQEEAVALVDDLGNVIQFLSFGGATITAQDGPANGQTSTDIGSQSDTGSLQSDDGGANYYAQATPNAGTVPCYAPGTLIATPGGPRAVETLREGELVVTVDHGPQVIRWVRIGENALEDAAKDAKPVLIAAGALGHDRPARDLIVSPQHRIRVGGADQLQALFGSDSLAAAKSLTALPGIRHMDGSAGSPGFILRWIVTKSSLPMAVIQKACCWGQWCWAG